MLRCNLSDMSKLSHFRRVLLSVRAKNMQLSCHVIIVTVIITYLVLLTCFHLEVPPFRNENVISRSWWQHFHFTLVAILYLDGSILSWWLYCVLVVVLYLGGCIFSLWQYFSLSGNDLIRGSNE